MGKAKKYYAVVRGFHPGIYTAWYGPNGAEEQVRGYPGAVFKGFDDPAEAKRWSENPSIKRNAVSRTRSVPAAGVSDPSPGGVVIYTDGGCIGNPGPGGYGAVVISGEKRIEIAQGFRWTTNNRMELMACIAALAELKQPSDVVLHSDSRYVVNGVDKDWARRWRANGWMRSKSEAAENVDLWAVLLDLCDRHRVRFVWVRGHAGNRENERCDQLATAAAQGSDLKEDAAFVRGRTRIV